MKPKPNHANLRWVWLILPVLIGAAGASGELPEFMRKPSPYHLRVLCYNINWDAIFESGDPDNHDWWEYDKSDEFVRVETAIDPDIVCLQEINWDRDPQDVADILDSALPLGDGIGWRAHSGSDNVIAARFDLSMLATDTNPTTNRSQAMALVDLPDETYPVDLYLMNAHFKASGGETNIARRQQHADAIIHWIGDIKTAGGYINLPAGTPIVVLGDLNVYDTDPHYHLTTLLTGDIVDEGTYGPDLSPDWNDTDNTDTLPVHNGVGADDWTWRDDSGSYNPGDLDHVIYTDSVVDVGSSFVLNTTTMSPADLTAAGLQANDVVLEAGIGYYDHLPLVIDFFIPGSVPGDLTGDGLVTLADWPGFVECLDGPQTPPSPPLPLNTAQCLQAFDFDDDSDVDATDFGAFQSLLGGS
ncbi:MAG: endonuclease/exonuclease/phosphatase family protein [bacterium]|nr:endonuclease/exonuclease/phosphatase family protein [bacterium]